MTRAHRRLLPEEMYPAGAEDAHASFIRLRSGLRVRIVEAGEPDAPPVVLVPGWGCGAWTFHFTLPSLAAAGFRAIAVELKGHGLSDKPGLPSEYTLDSMTSHLVDVLDALSLKRVRLAGHSMGAAIAAQVAAQDPERVESLVLIAPVGFDGVPGMALFRALTPAFTVSLLPLFAGRWLIRLMLKLVYGSLAHASSRDVDEYWAPTQFPGFTRALRHLLHEFTWTGPFPDIRIQWMTIAGTKDRLSSAASVTTTTGRGKRVVIEGAGHVVPEEAPKIMGAAMVEFFSGGPRPYIEPT